MQQDTVKVEHFLVQLQSGQEGITAHLKDHRLWVFPDTAHNLILVVSLMAGVGPDGEGLGLAGLQHQSRRVQQEGLPLTVIKVTEADIRLQRGCVTDGDLLHSFGETPTPHAVQHKTTLSAWHSFVFHKAQNERETNTHSALDLPGDRGPNSKVSVARIYFL